MHGCVFASTCGAAGQRVRWSGHDGGGIERLALLLEFISYKTQKSAPVYLIPIGEECENYIITLANKLRANGVAVSVELKGKIQKRMEKALKNDAKYIVFAGSDELKNNQYSLKILESKEERLLSCEEVLSFLR